MFTCWEELILACLTISILRSGNSGSVRSSYLTSLVEKKKDKKKTKKKFGGKKRVTDRFTFLWPCEFVPEPWGFQSSNFPKSSHIAAWCHSVGCVATWKDFSPHNESAVNIPLHATVHALYVPRDSPLTFCPAESTPPPSSSPFNFTVTHLLQQDLHLFTIDLLPGTHGYHVIFHLVALRHSPLIKS